MFLDQLRFYGNICHHPNDAFHIERQEEDGDRILKCRECDRGLSLRTFFRHTCTPYHSLTEAERYVEWTGDSFIPCCFSTHRLSSRTLATTLPTDYATVERHHLLLKMLHSPFMVEPESPTPAGLAFFQQTLASEWDALLQRALEEKETPPDVHRIVTNVLMWFKEAVTRESTRYFDVWAPYVKSVHRRALGETPLFVGSKSPRTLQAALEEQLSFSRWIHQSYARYSVVFDLVHVAVLCVLGRHQFRWVCDLLLEFVFQFWCGYYEAAFPFPGLLPLDPFEADLRQRWQSETPRLLPLFQEDHLADHFSDSFFKTFETWNRTLVVPESREAWIFPRLLFRHYADYYAFCAARAHYASCSNEENVIAECKIVYRCVKQSVSNVKAFEACLVEMQRQTRKGRRVRENEKTYYWSVEMVTLFLKIHPAWTQMAVKAMTWFCYVPAKEKKPKAPFRAFDQAHGRRFELSPIPASGRLMPKQMWHYYMREEPGTEVLPGSEEPPNHPWSGVENPRPWFKEEKPLNPPLDEATAADGPRDKEEHVESEQSVSEEKKGNDGEAQKDKVDKE